MNPRFFFGLPIVGFILMALSQYAAGQGVAPSPAPIAPSPAPIAPSNDRSAIDQGIAYVLMLLALTITYLIH